MNKISLRVKICIILFFLIFAGFVYNSLDAMSWPSRDANLIFNFGANNRGKPVLGMIFGGRSEVTAAENGTVIYTRNKDVRTAFDASRLPSPLGAWTAIDHRDGLISIYSRYAKSFERLHTEGQSYIEKEQIIADSGISGWSSRDGFYFMILDRRERRWINPAMILTPMQETRPPQIISVELRNDQGNVVGSRSLTQGRYTVLVNAAGLPLPVLPVTSAQHAPHRIVCSVNGAEVGSLNFEAVSARDGTLMVSRNGLAAARQVYANPPAFEAAEVFLTRGQVTLEVIVRDITGASRSVINRLIVN